jgi:hypothetical protein
MSTTIVGERFFIYACKAKAKQPIWSDDLRVGTPPAWMIELAEQVKLIEPELLRGAMLSAVIEPFAGSLFLWYSERMTTKLRVHFDGRVLVPEEPVDLPIGESVEIRVGIATRESIGAPGTPSSVLAAALSEPHISSEDVAELERTIVDSKLPAGSGVDFDGNSQ